MKIGNIDTDRKVFIVAEIGNNHEGNFELAKELVRKAAETGVDAVKFQTIYAETFVAKSEVDRFKRIKSFEFTIEQFRELSEIAKDEGLIFFSTPFDIDSVQRLNEFVPCFKIASGDNNYRGLIHRVAQTGKPLILSSGLSNFDSIKKIHDFIHEIWRFEGITQELAILHCVSSYPVPDDQANLNSISYLIENLKCPIGYSDHTLGTDAVIAAVTLGARIIEKHFTIDKNYSDFRDHKLSADIMEMQLLVKSIRRIEKMFGVKNKTIQACEEEGIKSSRRSVYSKTEIEQNTILTENNIISLRPNNGISTESELDFIGKKAKIKIERNILLKESDLIS
ncbi:MAG: N-acetylneuraminate synthase family protein [Leptospiraceae bacterium]|nr:N-acetylneuraminate synthase family protein [Leptospiraceae bacterium]